MKLIRFPDKMIIEQRVGARDLVMQPSTWEFEGISVDIELHRSPIESPVGPQV